MKAGAVMVERSPLNEAIDCRSISVYPSLDLEAAYLEEGCPGTLCLGRHSRAFFLSHDEYLWCRDLATSRYRAEDMLDWESLSRVFGGGTKGGEAVEG
jgi:hypothetical protein